MMHGQGGRATSWCPGPTRSRGWSFPHNVLTYYSWLCGVLRGPYDSVVGARVTPQHNFNQPVRAIGFVVRCPAHLTPRQRRGRYREARAPFDKLRALVLQYSCSTILKPRGAERFSHSTDRRPQWAIAASAAMTKSDVSLNSSTLSASPRRLRGQVRIVSRIA